MDDKPVEETKSVPTNKAVPNDEEVAGVEVPYAENAAIPLGYNEAIPLPYAPITISSPAAN